MTEPVRRRPDPLLVVVAGVAAGVVLAAARHPQPGMYVVAGALALGAVLRLVLRPRAAGSLVVRSRQLDVLVLMSLAVAIGVIAAVTPFPAGR
ncbi:MAG TPA: DUF3017 domain-containing protein [Mycobacteriales bacterium]|nr:DUF3017 domain-containing protein [Mycobacteriales bacterium]